MAHNSTALSTPAAAERLGLTSPQFRRIAEQKVLVPVDYYDNPHYKAGPQCPLWDISDIRRISRHVAVKKLRAKNETPKRTKDEICQDKLAKMNRKYGEPNAAVPDACDAMFNLNRYVKHRSCNCNNRDDIYSLKEHLISRLISLGLQTEVGLHKIEYAAKECFGCNGTGRRPYGDDYMYGDNYLYGDDYLDGDDCERCDGTGIYEPASMKTFVVFRFLVLENRYCWHSPASQFVARFEDAPVLVDDWQPGEGDKPLAMSPEKLSEAKDVVRYAIGHLCPRNHALN